MKTKLFLAKALAILAVGGAMLMPVAASAASNQHDRQEHGRQDRGQDVRNDFVRTEVIRRNDDRDRRDDRDCLPERIVRTVVRDWRGHR
jgi:hypothetical protein